MPINMTKKEVTERLNKVSRLWYSVKHKVKKEDFSNIRFILPNGEVSPEHSYKTNKYNIENRISEAINDMFSNQEYAVCWMRYFNAVYKELKKYDK